MPESLYRVRPEVGMLNRTQVEKLMREAGHAVNANNGKCYLIEDVLCQVTTLCVELLNEFDEREHKEKRPCPTA